MVGDTALIPMGYTLTVCEIPSKAYRRLIEVKPDVILLDHHLEEIKPLDFIQSLSVAHPDLPIVMLAPEEADQHFMRAVFLAGCADCLIPPYSQEQLDRAIHVAMRRKKSWQYWVDRQVQKRHDQDMQRVDGLESIVNMGRRVTSQLDLDAVLSNVVQAAVSLTGAEEGSLLLLDDDNEALTMRAAFNFNDEFVRTFRLPVNDSLAGQVIKTGQPIVLDVNSPQKIKTHYLVYSLLYVPLTLKQRVIGVLGVDNRTSLAYFEEHHVNLLSSLADYASIALENARLYTLITEERDNLDAVISRVDNGVLVVGPTGNIKLANSRAQQMLGVTGELVEGQPANDHIKFKRLAEVIAQSLANKTIPRRIEFSGEDNNHYLAEIASVPNVGLAVTIQDITHFKELDRIKTDFVNTVSHDLRSPLTAIMGYAELIGRVGEVDAQQQEFIQRVKQNVHNITSLIDDLLDLGRLEAGFAGKKEHVAVGGVMMQVIETLRPKFESKKHTLDVSIPEYLPLVQGEEARLRQLMEHLLDNAIKYTPDGGQIQVKITDESGQLILQVTDNGIGIVPADQPYIFDKLFRGRNIPDDTAGAGLGLALVRSIVSNHNGRLWFVSEAGKGSTFTVVLPTDPM